MTNSRAHIIAVFSLSALFSTPLSFADSQTLEKQVVIESNVTDGSIERTRSFHKQLGTGETANGSVTEHLIVDESGQHYTKSSSRSTLDGQQISSSISNQVQADSNTMTRNYNRTLTNQSTGESITRTRDTEVIDTGNGATWTRADSISGNNQAIDSSVSGSVVQNEDGTTTVDRERTYTNNTGQSVTRTQSTDVAQAEDGTVNVSKQNSLTGSEGRSLDRSSNASVSQNSEGGREYAATRTVDSGNGRNTEVTRSGRTTSDGNGTRTYDASRSRQNSEGSSRQTQRRGSVSQAEGMLQRERFRSRTHSQ